MSLGERKKRFQSLLLAIPAHPALLYIYPRLCRAVAAASDHQIRAPASRCDSLAVGERSGAFNLIRVSSKPHLFLKSALQVAGFDRPAVRDWSGLGPAAFNVCTRRCDQGSATPQIVLL